MTISKCLIQKTPCGLQEGNPVCTSCGIDTRMRYVSKEDSEAPLVKALAVWAITEQKSQTAAGGGTSGNTKSPREPEISVPPLTPHISGQPHQPPVATLSNRYIFGAFALLLCVSGGGYALWQQQQAKEKAAQVTVQIAQEQRVTQEAQQKTLQETQTSLKVARDHAKDIEAKANADKQAGLPREREISQKPIVKEEHLKALVSIIDNRYKVLGDGNEVKDLLTGLIWQRCSVGQQWAGSTCQGNVKTFTFDDAQKQAVNGWRIPTIRELYSLVWCSSGKTREHVDPRDGKGAIESQCDGEYTEPTIHQAAFPPPVYNSWSSSPHYANNAWLVGFFGGDINSFDRDNSFAVRLVR